MVDGRMRNMDNRKWRILQWPLSCIRIDSTYIYNEYMLRNILNVTATLQKRNSRVELVEEEHADKGW